MANKNFWCRIHHHPVVRGLNSGSSLPQIVVLLVGSSNASILMEEGNGEDGYEGGRWGIRCTPENIVDVGEGGAHRGRWCTLRKMVKIKMVTEEESAHRERWWMLRKMMHVMKRVDAKEDDR